MKKIIAFCVAGLITLSADAAILRLDFSGFVGSVTTSSGLPPIRETDILAGIQGDPVSGSYLIDTSAANVLAFSPSLGLAVYNGGTSFITASTFSVAGVTFSSDDIAPFQTRGQISVADDPSTDGYEIVYIKSSSLLNRYSLGVRTQAVLGSADYTNGLGFVQPLSGAFLANPGGINGFDYGLQSAGINLSLGYTVTNAQITEVSAVPLPAAVWLFGSGLLGLGALARKGLPGSAETFVQI